MPTKISQLCQGNFNFHSGDLAQKPLWQSLISLGSLLVLSVTIAPSPAWSNERSPDSTVSEDVSVDIEKLPVELEELPEISDLFDSQQIPTVTDLPVYSTQAKDLLVQNTSETTPAPTSDSSHQNENEETSEPVEPKPDPFSNKLGKDWGGFRRNLANSGISFDLSTTQFFQGAISGLDNSDFDYTGVIDLFLNVDTEKAGLWKGGGFGTHLIYAYGNTDFASLGNAGIILPANMALFEPQLRGNAFEVSSFYLSQKLGNKATLLLGKMNAFDLLASDPFFGGRGSDRSFVTS